MADSPKSENAADVEILLVDDHTDFRRALVRMLGNAGYKVVEAESVGEAIRKFDGQAIALLDFNLPDGEGTVVYQHIRQGNHPTKVAFLTACYDPVATLKARGIISESVFQKPIELNSLMTWLYESASRPNSTPGGRISRMARSG